MASEFQDVGGVRLYGRSEGAVTVEELRELVADPPALLHITGHLQRLSVSARESLLVSYREFLEKEAPGTEQAAAASAALDRVVGTAGSKFHEMVDDPVALVCLSRSVVIEAACMGRGPKWRRTPAGDRRAALAWDVDAATRSRFGLPPAASLGWSAVVPITPDLSPRVQRQVRGKGEGDQVEVNILPGVSPRTTSTLVITMYQLPGTSAPQVLTAHPGPFAPDLPRESQQSAEEVAYNREWWARHAFVTGST